MVQACVDDFPPISGSSLDLSMPKQPLPLRLSPHGWLIGDPLPRIKPEVVPVATLSLGPIVAEHVSSAAFRVALLGERGNDASVHSQGWRFETGEVTPPLADPSVTPPAHPYCHAQAIIGWTRDSPCLLHPPHLEADECDGTDGALEEVIHLERRRVKAATLVQHPAFPVAAQTLTGLAATMIATLYGAQPTSALLCDDSRLARSAGLIHEDLERLGVFA